MICFAALWNQATVSSLLSGFDILMKVARFYSEAVIKKIGFGRKEKNLGSYREKKLNLRLSDIMAGFEMCLMVQGQRQLGCENRSRTSVTKRNLIAAAAAAKSCQLCPTLCDPTDGSPPGSSIPGIL